MRGASVPIAAFSDDGNGLGADAPLSRAFFLISQWLVVFQRESPAHQPLFRGPSLISTLHRDRDGDFLPINRVRLDRDDFWFSSRVID